MLYRTGVVECCPDRFVGSELLNCVLTSTMLDHVTQGAPDLSGSGMEEGEEHGAGGGGGEEEEVEPGGSGVRAVVGSVLLLLIVSTLLGNTLVCAAVVKFRHLRSKVTNVFVVSLAVSDLLLALLVMPWEASPRVWIACDIMCSTASILNLCIISLDRYWAISSPFRYERRMTHRVAFLMIGVAWTLSVLISFIPVHLNWHRAEGAGQGEAAANWTFDMPAVANDTPAPTESCVANLNKTYAIASSLISFYIPVAIMTQIRRIAALERVAMAEPTGAQENLLKTSFRKETKVLKTLSVIMGVFVCCWSPFFLLNCTVPFCRPPCVSDTAFTVAVWFGWANSSLNPVIYAFNADFRRAFSTLLGCHAACSRNAVEAMNLSNELVSYHHDTTALQQQQQHRHDTALKHSQDTTALQKEEEEAPLHLHSSASDPAGSDSGAASDVASLVSASSRSHKNLLLLPAACDGQHPLTLSLTRTLPRDHHTLLLRTWWRTDRTHAPPTPHPLASGHLATIGWHHCFWEMTGEGKGRGSGGRGGEETRPHLHRSSRLPTSRPGSRLYRKQILVGLRERPHHCPEDQTIQTCRTGLAEAQLELVQQWGDLENLENQGNQEDQRTQENQGDHRTRLHGAARGGAKGRGPSEVMRSEMKKYKEEVRRRGEEREEEEERRRGEEEERKRGEEEGRRGEEEERRRGEEERRRGEEEEEEEEEERRMGEEEERRRGEEEERGRGEEEVHEEGLYCSEGWAPVCSFFVSFFED
ncbi:hypothetical protein CRUP_026840 [Coryphaenoides rupestris]|nr:hypothetical protein CRUP_026840 [Coryphaenoides rupestris]